MSPILLLVALMGVGVVTGATGQCLQPSRCAEVDSECRLMECFSFFHSAKSTPTHLLSTSPPLLLLPLPPSISPSAGARMPSYSLEHFRWGKPVGRKRHPIGIFPREVDGEWEEDGTAGQTRRREADQQQEEEQLSKNREGRRVQLRWSPLLASKRYGGFMKGGDERSQRPLITLFRNVIKDGQEEEGMEG
ncbi:pro-opiomelanocortin A-like [Nelusetta ayraudi]|uniref:pro-opiomelanocortin A-like n=1 Tax=Nelusetta ayraudi TaxID=303726 RepID=UPI003F6EC231